MGNETTWATNTNRENIKHVRNQKWEHEKCEQTNKKQKWRKQKIENGEMGKWKLWKTNNNNEIMRNTKMGKCEQPNNN